MQNFDPTNNRLENTKQSMTDDFGLIEKMEENKLHI